MLDWLGRAALLILSGLATMALIASIASVSNIGPVEPVDRTPRPPAEAVFETTPPDPERPSPAQPEPAAPDATGTGSVALADEPPEDTGNQAIARALESLTWAVLALAGFVAAILLVLLRITAHLARIARG